MVKSDIKRDRRALYAPRAGTFQLVDVPELPFLMLDGKGNPYLSDPRKTQPAKLRTILRQPVARPAER